MVRYVEHGESERRCATSNGETQKSAAGIHMKEAGKAGARSLEGSVSRHL